MSAAPALAPPMRDPQARRRLGLVLIALVLLWPLLQLAQFRPARLFDAGHLQVMGDFLAALLRPNPQQILPALRGFYFTSAQQTQRQPAA